MPLAGYDYFLDVAKSVQWDEYDVDLTADAANWPRLDPDFRTQVMGLLAGFCIAEWAVADELPAFADVIDNPVAAACLRMQDGDEARHSKFFDRVVAEVAQVPGASRHERRAAVRHQMSPEFLRLFEDELPERAAQVGHDGGIAAGVGFYHMVLEGVVLIAGQFAFFDILDENSELPGIRQGVELVHRDERWHIGMGARCLQDLQLKPGVVDRILQEGEEAVEVWGDLVAPKHTQKMMQLHKRRLRAAGLLKKQAAT